jgi:hypothetical protein
VFNKFGEVIFRNSDLSDMIFKAYHESSLLFEKCGMNDRYLNNYITVC